MDLPAHEGAASLKWDVTVLAITGANSAELESAQRVASRLGVNFAHQSLTVGGPTVLRKARSLMRPNSEYLQSGAVLDAFDRASERAEGIHLDGSLAAGRLFAGRASQGTIHLFQLDEMDWELRAHEGMALEWRRLRARRTSRQVLPELRTILVHSPAGGSGGTARRPRFENDLPTVRD